MVRHPSPHIPMIFRLPAMRDIEVIAELRLLPAIRRLVSEVEGRPPHRVVPLAPKDVAV